jgi:hypothetical protein
MSRAAANAALLTVLVLLFSGAALTAVAAAPERHSAPSSAVGGVGTALGRVGSTGGLR